ncbi:MAG: DUF3124 domain-containing protein [Desulfocurvibacter africanus]
MVNIAVRSLLALAFMTGMILSVAFPAWAQSGPTLSRGQTLYVPAYSHTYQGPRSRPYQLTVMLSIRNTDLRRALTITSVEYFNSEGKLVRSQIKEPIRLPAMGTKEFLVEQNDLTGGSGANFIVRWRASEPINAPIVETVMVGSSAGQGISFTGPAREIAE